MNQLVSIGSVRGEFVEDRPPFGRQGDHFLDRTLRFEPRTLGPARAAIGAEVTTEVATAVLRARALTGKMTRSEFQQALGLKNEEHFCEAYLRRTLESGLIEMTILHKPRSRLQKYWLRDAGKTQTGKDT